MDVSIQYGKSVSKDVNTSHDLMQSCINSKQGTGTIGDTLVTVLRDAFSEVLHIPDVQESVSSCIPPSEALEISCHENEEMCEVSKEHQAKPLITTSQKSLSKSATIPCSRMTLLCADPVDMKIEMISGTAMQGKNSVEYGSPTFSRSVSLPTPIKVASAMKGSREKQGLPPKILTMTWAPDVYDPPTTSLSHSTKSQGQQCSRTYKKNAKHKHKGKKSSRGSSNDKKQYRKTAGRPDMRLKSPATSDRLCLHDIGHSAVEFVDFSVAGPDSKCSDPPITANGSVLPNPNMTFDLQKQAY